MDTYENQTMSVPQAGKMLGIAKAAAYRAAKSGEIPTIRLGGKLRVSKEVVKEMLSAKSND